MNAIDTTWVLCAGMLRSGSTLQYQLAADIVEKHARGKRIAYFPEDGFDEARREYDGTAEFLVYKTHVCTDEKASIVSSGRGKVLYAYRDIRDVIVSASRKFSMSVDQLLSNGWIDSAIQDSFRWTSLQATLVAKYEEFTADLGTESRRIADHIGLPISSEYAQLLAMRYSVENQRRRLPQRPSARGFDDSAEPVFDQTSLLHYNHIADGAIGKWMFRLTVRQMLEIERRYGDWLVKHGYAV